MSIKRARSKDRIDLMADDKKAADDARAKFLEALEKKKHKNTSLPGGGTAAGPKVGGAQAGGAPAPRFQRKSGPSGSAG